LDEGTFDLTVVDGGVDAAAYVHFNVGAQHGVITSEYVEFDFADGDTLSLKLEIPL
jgi:hypothetical protein